MSAALPRGVTVSTGVVLTEGQARYLALLRKQVPASTPLHVTSGVRDVEDQARAMLAKYKAGGAQELYDVYAADATISQLVAAPKTVSAWSAVIAKATAGGVRLTRHLGGGSIDLRSRNWTTAQRNQVQVAVTQTGGRSLYEDAPPHLHVDLPKSYAAMSAVERAGTEMARGARRSASMWVTLSVVGAAVLGILVLRRNRLAAASGEKAP